MLFDDRVPHAVQRVEGPMDPVEGRFVLHGHLSEAGVVAQGGLHADQVKAVADAALDDAAGGRVAVGQGAAGHAPDDFGARQRRRHPRRSSTGSPAAQATTRAQFRSAVIDALTRARFPASDAVTTANVPLIF